MSYFPDNRNTIDATNTKLGEDIRRLAVDTVTKLHDIVADSPEISNRSNTLTGYMLNDTMVFMQMIEYMITAHKASTASAYQRTKEKFGDGL